MKKNFNTAYAMMIRVIPLLLLCGCAGHAVRGRLAYPVGPKSGPELQRLINQRAEEATPLKLKGRITYWEEPDAKPRSCLALIIAKPPRKLRVKGYRQLGPTLFEAAASGEKMLLYTHSTGEITKPSNTSEEAFYGRLLEGIMETIFPSPIPNEEILLMECVPDYYIVSLADKEGDNYHLTRKIGLESTSLNTVSVAHFNRQGIPLMIAAMRNYKEAVPTYPPLPFQISILWPEDGAFLQLSLKSIDRAEKIPPGIFSLTDLQEQ